MKIVFTAILLFGALIAVNAEPFAKPSDESMEVIAAAERENEDKILNAMMNHIVASVMQSNDDGNEDLMSMMMGENNVSGEQCAQLQWKFFKKIRKGLKKFFRSPITKNVIKYGPYLRYLGKK